jgi:RNA polymerase sigma-70 factor (ECF subfamily)
MEEVLDAERMRLSAKNHSQENEETPMKGNHTERVAELVNRHGRMVFAAAYRILGNADDAEDVLQDVFLKILGGWNGRLKPHAIQDWGAYLRVAASRRAVDLLRRNRSWEQNTRADIETVEAPVHQNPRNVAIQREKASLLRKALRSLPKREARVFALRCFEGLSYDQIAEHMGLSVNLVGVVLHRARGRLQRILEPLVGPSAQDASRGRDPGAPEEENSRVAEEP